MMESGPSNSACCEFCGKVFSTKFNLNRHLKNTNQCRNVPEYAFGDALFKCMEDCQVSFKTTQELRRHLTTQHGFEIMKHTMKFDRYDEFETWLLKEEKKENARYFKSRGIKRNADNTTEKLYLYCSRTGKDKLVCQKRRKRGEWSQGSSKPRSKLIYGCTSQIIVTRDISSDVCFVEYFSTHYSHEQHIQHLRTPKRCRKKTSSKLMMGVSKTSILEHTKGNIGENLNRDDILTQQDINIKISYKMPVTDTSEVKKLVADISNESPIAVTKSKPDKLNIIRSEASQLLTNLNSLNYTEEEQIHLIRTLKMLNSLGASAITTGANRKNLDHFIPIS